MKKLIASLAASACILGATPAMAHRSYGEPAAPWVFQGELDVYKGIRLTCLFKLTVTGPNDAADSVPSFSHTDLVNASTSIEIISRGWWDLICPTIEVDPIPAPNLSYNYVTNAVSLSGVNVTTPTPGGCAGTLTATFGASSTASTLSVNTTLPGGGTSAPCTIEGTLTQTTPTPATGAGVQLYDAADPTHNPLHHNRDH